MEPIIIEGTPKTPTVKFDSTEGVFEIKGRSIPENSVEFYKPLVDWLDSIKSLLFQKPLLIFVWNISIQAHQNVFSMYLRNLKQYIRLRMR